MEILVRFAKIKYLENNVCVKNIKEAINKLLADCIYPNAMSCNGLDFR